jgi:hypothetical protein
MSSLSTVVYAVLHVGLVIALVTGIVLVGHGKVVPRHIRQLRKQQEANHFADGLTVKRCLHSSVPWPVVTIDGTLVAWLCEDCMEERDDFKPPPRKAKSLASNIVPFIPIHEHEWCDIRTMDGWLIHRTCHCGVHFTMTSQMEFELDAEYGGKPTYNARPRW